MNRGYLQSIIGIVGVPDLDMLPCTIHKRGRNTMSTGSIVNGGYMQRMLHEVNVNYTGTVPHSRGNLCSSHQQ